MANCYNKDMSVKKILAKVRKADEMFGLIEDGDRIAVGVSGGKDSTLLLYVLHLYQYLAKNALNKSFDLIGIHIDLNFGEDDTQALREFFGRYDIAYYEEKSKIADILDLNRNNGRIDCSLCSTLKKGSVIKAAKELGFSKVAFAHHGDDAHEKPLHLAPVWRTVAGEHAIPRVGDGLQLADETLVGHVARDDYGVNPAVAEVCERLLERLGVVALGKRAAAHGQPDVYVANDAEPELRLLAAAKKPRPASGQRAKRRDAAEESAPRQPSVINSPHCRTPA